MASANKRDLPGNNDDENERTDKRQRTISPDQSLRTIDQFRRASLLPDPDPDSADGIVKVEVEVGCIWCATAYCRRASVSAYFVERLPSGSHRSNVPYSPDQRTMTLLSRRTNRTRSSISVVLYLDDVGETVFYEPPATTPTPGMTLDEELAVAGYSARDLNACR